MITLNGGQMVLLQAYQDNTQIRVTQTTTLTLHQQTYDLPPGVYTVINGGFQPENSAGNINSTSGEAELDHDGHDNRPS